MAELIVTHAHGRSRGSGYRINATSVLTAAHVVANAVSVTVRFSPDLPSEQTVTALSWQADPVTDIAYIEIPPQSGEDVQFGRVGTRAAVLQAQAVGFPLWKMRDGQYRDSHHAVGTVAVLSNFREGTLEFVVASPPAPVEGRSPWEGMSGAALWVDGRIVGVVSKHHPGDGLGRLAVAPIGGDFPDVIPMARTHDALLADIAPAELLDRSGELASLVSFCAGDEPYMWWQAGPWAGKTALLSWFALHPPAGVDVVSFVITAGQSDSGTFLESMIDQLGETAPPNRANLLRLLQTATERSVAAGRRLLLVVDGLDEDTSSQAAARPSIASLLPRRVQPGMRVLVASRPNPQLPDDVPGDHPLRALNPRLLTASTSAHRIEVAARNELSQLLHGEPLYQEILGLLTASGSGLTVADIGELTGKPRYELDRVFGSVFARSLTNRQQTYLFAHKTLRETAEHQYGTSLAAFRDRIHAWALSYQDSSWPRETPRYLLFDYSELLVSQGDIPRLVALGTDRLRHARMLERTGADLYAMVEIDLAARSVAQSARPDLTVLARLATARTNLDEQNTRVPAALPAVCAVLGEVDRAIALARSFPDNGKRVTALTRVIMAVPVAPHVIELAELAADGIGPGMSRAEALSELAKAAAAVGDHRRCHVYIDAALEATHDFNVSYAHDAAFTESGRAAAMIGDYDRAVELALGCLDVFRKAEAMNAIATVAILAGDRARAHELARRTATLIEDSVASEWSGMPYSQEDVTGALQAIGHGDPEVERIVLRTGRPARYSHLRSVMAYVDTAVDLAPAGDHSLVQAAVNLATPAAAGDGGMLSNLALAASLAGDRKNYERLILAAEAAALAIDYPPPRTRALTRLVTAAAKMGDTARFRRLLVAARSAARAVDPDWQQAKDLVELAMAAGTGDQRGARELIALAQAVSQPTAGRLSNLYGSDLVEAAALIGDDERAGRIGALIDSDSYRAVVLVKASMRLAASGDRRGAVALAMAADTAYMVDPEDAFGALCAVAQAMAAVGDGARYRELFASAEEMTFEEDLKLYRRTERLAALALLAAQGGDLARAVDLAGEAEELAGIDRERTYTTSVLEPAVEALAVAGEFADAQALARRVDLDGDALHPVVSALIGAGRLDEAERLAREISDGYWAAEPLGEVAAAAALNGEQSRAMRLAASAESAARALADTRLRDLTLGRLAAVLSAAQDLDEITRRLVIEVLTTPSWSRALVAIARLDPDAVRNLCDEVLSGRG